MAVGRINAIAGLFSINEVMIELVPDFRQVPALKTIYSQRVPFKTSPRPDYVQAHRGVATLGKDYAVLSNVILSIRFSRNRPYFNPQQGGLATGFRCQASKFDRPALTGRDRRYMAIYLLR